VEAQRNGHRPSQASPAQLTSCPWCGSEIRLGNDVIVDQQSRRTFIYCSDKLSKCQFSRGGSLGGLPILVVDEEIYRRPPSMMIATVDKFAIMAWRGETRTLFGRASKECDRHGLLWPDADCSGNHPKRGTVDATKVRQIRPLRPPDL